MLISELDFMKIGHSERLYIPANMVDTTRPKDRISDSVYTIDDTDDKQRRKEEIETVFDSDLIYKTTKSIHDNLYQRPTNQSCKKQFPSCLLIGVYKCGTRELMDFISMHPNIEIKTDPYEFSYFNSPRYRDDNSSLNWYRQKMPCVYNDQISMMKNPGYFPNALVPGRIYKSNKDIKLILMVRDPVQRFISHVWFNHPLFTFVQLNKYIDANLYREQISPVNASVVKHTNKSRPGKLRLKTNFRKTQQRSISSEIRKLLQLSIYDEPYQRYLRYFNKDQILIIESGEFKNNPASVLFRIESFLNLPHRIPKDRIVYNTQKKYYCIKSLNGSHVCYSQRRGRQYTKEIISSTQQKLQNYFHPHNEHFFSLIGKRFNWED